MMNSFGLGNDNGCLWMLIIILIICCCGNGNVCGIFDKLCNCSYLLPIILVLLCCCNKDNAFGGKHFGGLGCGCK